MNEIIRTAQADGAPNALSMERFGIDYATSGAGFDVDALGQEIS